jgi:hypothetical protein
MTILKLSVGLALVSLWGCGSVGGVRGKAFVPNNGTASSGDANAASPQEPRAPEQQGEPDPTGPDSNDPTTTDDGVEAYETPAAPPTANANIEPGVENPDEPEPVPEPTPKPLPTPDLKPVGDAPAPTPTPKPTPKPTPTPTPTQAAMPLNPKITDAIFRLTGNGSIVNPDQCSGLIGEGGNYIENSKRLSGKCTAGVKPPYIAKRSETDRYVAFETTGEVGDTSNRVELAHTPYFAFSKKVYFSFDLMIPKGSPVWTESSLFPLQFWQCAPLSPIAGIRLKPNTSHTLTFFTRHQNNSTSATAAEFSMKPGAWHSFLMGVQPNPKGGHIEIWADGKMIADQRVAYGSDVTGQCHGVAGTPPQHSRIKFGIYTGMTRTPIKIGYDNAAAGYSIRMP